MPTTSTLEHFTIKLPTSESNEIIDDQNNVFNDVITADKRWRFYQLWINIIIIDSDIKMLKHPHTSDTVVNK